MKRDLDKWSLVVVGHWNTAILSPDWLAKEVFGRQEVRIMFPVLGGGQPIFEAADIRVVVGSDRLVFVPLKDDEDLLRKIEKAAGHVLETLPYTPVSAFGENFHYTVEGSPPRIGEVLKFSDDDALTEQGSTSEVSLKRSLALDNCQLNLTIAFADVFRIELNYHYNVKNATEAKGLMKDTYLENRNIGLELLKEVYDLTMEEEANND